MGKGEYCIDYDVNYEEGDEFKKLRNIPTVEECRQKCLEESQCKYYVWRGSTRRNNVCSNLRDYGYQNMKKVLFQVPLTSPLVEINLVTIMDFAIVLNLSQTITIRILLI